MYVCICKKVTDRQVREAVTKQGARNLRSLCKQLDACNQCGKCVPEIHQILKDSLAERQLPRQRDIAA